MNRRSLIAAAASLPLVGRRPIAAQEQSFDVPILGQTLSLDELKQQIATEASLTVFDARTTAAAQLAEQFRQFIAATYGVDITVSIDQTSSVDDLIVHIQTSAGERISGPVDVMTTTADQWMTLRIAGHESGLKVVEEFLPSDLVPNYERSFTALRLGASIATCQMFNASAMIYDSARVDWLTDWTDLADSRLKDRILLWSPGDQIADGMLLGLSSALKFDYRNPDQMDATINYLVENIQANALRYTTDVTEVETLLRDGTIDVAILWTSFARQLSQTGLPTARSLLAKKGHFPFNDQLWIPAGPVHPVLAQLYIDWRLSDAAVFPDRQSWGQTDEQWLLYHQGILGKSYENAVPDWVAPTYFDFYPKADQFYTQIEEIDWEYYVNNVASWRETWKTRAGL